jgi:hypothetical protein
MPPRIFFNEDGKKVFVEFEEFMQLILDLRDGQPATVKDVHYTGKSCMGKFYRATSKMDSIQDKLANVDSRLNSILSKKAANNVAPVKSRTRLVAQKSAARISPGANKKQNR